MRGFVLKQVSFVLQQVSNFAGLTDGRCLCEDILREQGIYGRVLVSFSGSEDKINYIECLAHG